MLSAVLLCASAPSAPPIGNALAELPAVPWHLIKHVIAALLTIFAVLGFALAIAQDQVTLRIDSTVAAGDPAFPGYVGTLVGAPITSGNEFEVLENGDQIFPSMLQAIQAAERQIDFETYIYTDGQIADRFNSALEQAARRGVDVKFTVDAIGSKKLSNDTLRRLGRAGCQVAQFNAPSKERSTTTSPRQATARSAT